MSGACSKKFQSENVKKETIWKVEAYKGEKHLDEF
jgi:hypothetical protein